jgi:hypothetical protein
MKLVTIEQHPSHSAVFDQFIEGMKVDAECRASIRQAAYAYHFNMPACAEYGHPCGITVLAPPECPPEVIAECDFTGSTAAMADFAGRKRPPRVALLTECSMSDNVMRRRRTARDPCRSRK